MKYFITFIMIVFLLFITCSAYGNPFLIADPQNASVVTHYVVELNGNTEIIQADSVNSSYVKLWYDLEGINEGRHSVSVWSRNNETDTNSSVPANLIFFWYYDIHKLNSFGFGRFRLLFDKENKPKHQIHFE